MTAKEVILEDIYAGQYGDMVESTFEFTNVSDRDIRAFTGVTVYSDLFGREIIAYNLTYEDGLTAGQTVQWVGVVDVNPYIDEDVRLRDIAFENLVMDFELHEVIFTDGSRQKYY